ncbi:MAG: hypothetical protein AUJ74_00265 [Candidatus Omnitrophica bacterium CG1_02_44_16]|nr:MAG: hypothetical protein AUJ74_00265 [Candidatus Omnitrophica bacterium CG1_02_44_16]PIZ84201.1 MAG: hypothetical protein COX96_05035 [Candidatus Omnitrophica bacterium CG_4_10_14_0_2_um_filter_44_9]
MHKNIKTFINCLCMSVMIVFFIVCPSVYAQAADDKTVDNKEAAVDQNLLVSPAGKNVSVPSADDEQSSRNPFQSYIAPEEESAVEVISGAGGLPQTPSPSGVSEDKFDYSSLRVTGLVWGNDMPKAIINDQVMGIGDVINEAKIFNITREGILFEFKDKQYLMKRESVDGKPR